MRRLVFVVEMSFAPNPFLVRPSCLSYLLPVVGEGLGLVELEGLACDERGADGVYPLEHALQMPVSLQGGQSKLQDQPIQLHNRV